MAIRRRNCQLYGWIQGDSDYWMIPIQNTAPTYHVAATTLTLLSVGSSIGGFPAGGFFTKGAQSIFLTPTLAAGVGPIGIKVVGFNQFGDPVSEIVTLPVAGTTGWHTVNCYSQVTSMTIASLAGNAAGGGDTLAVGYSLTVPNNPLVAPLTAQLSATKSVLFVSNLNQTTPASQPTFTTVLNPVWGIQCATNPIVANGVGFLGVVIDGNDNAL